LGGVGLDVYEDEANVFRFTDAPLKTWCGEPLAESTCPRPGA